MNDDLISRSALKEQAETVTLWNGDVRRFVSYETIDNAPTVEPELSYKQIEQITDLLETEWGYEGIREDVARILRGGRE